MGLIADEWEVFREMVLGVSPGMANPKQIEALKMAFYGGVSKMLSTVVEVIEGDGSDTEGIEKLHRVYDEIMEYAVQTGTAAGVVAGPHGPGCECEWEEEHGHGQGQKKSEGH